jgi:RNA polymerase sigma-70 factor, ECF subfamily
MDAIDVTGSVVAHGSEAIPDEGATAATVRLMDAVGDGATFVAVYEAHYQSIYRYALLGTRRRDDADDVTADTFARAFHAWSRGHRPAGRPLPWLLLICRRLLLDRWRRQRLIGWLPLSGGGPAGRGRDDAVDLDPAADDAAIRAREFWLWLDAVTRVLPERQREVLFLRYERDLSDDEIGEILGLTSSGVRSLIARAIASLRRHPELLT